MKIENITDNYITINMNNNADIYRSDITETILNFIELFIKEHPQDYSQTKFTNIIFDNVYDLLNLTLSDIIPLDYEMLVEIIYENIQYYFKTCGLPRSYDSSLIINKINTAEIKEKLTYLEKKPQPSQKTKEWFDYRWKMLTASSAWQALDTAAAQNRLIYKKCCPLDIHKCFRVNINSPLHHGQKYEPISVMLYENMYKTTIKEFGCIQHSHYAFIGASPDGINAMEDNPRYGRMLEIKNIVNREITGIPKKEYWIQMQLQMEVCNLPECDFLETRFKEYQDEQEFLDDGGFDCSKIKGIIVCFHSRNGPVYKYSPFLSICEEVVCRKWVEECMEENKTMTWVHNIYWVLDEYSCVLVPRNKAWFESSLPQFKNIWNTILYERTNGYAHRKPKKKEKKNIILKVRTESFDQISIQGSAI